jgi:hypothetical protein
MDQEILKELPQPNVLMSRRKNFCTIHFYDFKPTQMAQFDNLPPNVKISGQYVDVLELDKEVQRIQDTHPDLKPNELVRQAIVNIIRSNDLPPAEMEAAVANMLKEALK